MTLKGAVTNDSDAHLSHHLPYSCEMASLFSNKGVSTLLFLASSDYYAISLYPYLTTFYDTPYPVAWGQYCNILVFGYMHPLGVVSHRPQSAAAYEQQEPTTRYGVYGNCWRDSGDSGRYR
jgi:hypothetical protein